MFSREIEDDIDKGERVKCRNCNHEIVELSTLLEANSRYAHFSKKYGATVMCEIGNCKCSAAK